jgi:hypothetical protein
VEGAGLVDEVGSVFQDQEGADLAQDGDFVGSLVGGGFRAARRWIGVSWFPFVLGVCGFALSRPLRGGERDQLVNVAIWVKPRAKAP